MAKEMQAYYQERLRAMQKRAVEQPRELQALDARIAALRARLRKGDELLMGDKLEVVIAKVEAKRAALVE